MAQLALKLEASVKHERCLECCGSTKRMVWAGNAYRFAADACRACSGTGWPTLQTRLKTLSNGAAFEDVSGARYVVVAKSQDGVTITKPDGSGREFCPHNPAVMLLNGI